MLHDPHLLVSRPLVVASYNVRELRDDRRAVVDVIRAMAPDLLAVQEAPKGWGWRRRCAALAAECGMRIVAGYRDKGAGNLILVRPAVPVLDTMTLHLPRRPFRRSRTAVFVRCAAFGSQRIVVTGTHLDTVAARRGDQIERVAAAVKAFAAVEDALIVAGDFNETPGGVVWRRLSALGLTDVGAADPAPTFSVGSPRRRIDAIFCSASLVSKNYRVWRAGGVAAASDHFPIVAEFGAPRRDSCP